MHARQNNPLGGSLRSLYFQLQFIVLWFCMCMELLPHFGVSSEEEFMGVCAAILGARFAGCPKTSREGSHTSARVHVTGREPDRV